MLHAHLYLEEEAQHEGQCPEAEAGTDLLGVDAPVGVQALLLLHLLQLQAQRRQPSFQAV